jgi:hypothetical protein
MVIDPVSEGSIDRAPEFREDNFAERGNAHRGRPNRTRTCQSCLMC